MDCLARHKSFPYSKTCRCQASYTASNLHPVPTSNQTRCERRATVGVLPHGCPRTPQVRMWETLTRDQDGRAGLTESSRGHGVLQNLPGPNRMTVICYCPHIHNYPDCHWNVMGRLWKDPDHCLHYTR
jgi:hypothetical protein